MMHRCGIFLLALFLVAAAGCGGKAATGGKDVGSGPDTQETSGGEICLGCTPCSSVDDCGDPGTCVSKVACVEGACEIEYKAEGTPCEEGCFVDGQCDGVGQCADTTLKDCPEDDGSLCTEPKCDTKTGECVEEEVADGEEPYAGSDCWTGVVCHGGEEDKTNATPTAKEEECQILTDELSPFGCTDQYKCEAKDLPCKAVYKTEGVQCWESLAQQGDTCQGRECNGEGECAIAPGLNEECGLLDYPVECTGSCVECTELLCDWVVDDDKPNKKMKHCHPQAKVGPDATCTDGDQCTLNDACGLDPNKPVVVSPFGFKETFGACTGVEKTKQQCAEELGYAHLPCIEHGIQCLSDNGCDYDGAKANEWCQNAFEGECIDLSKSKCSLWGDSETGGKYYPANGCYIVWLDETAEPCDDGNECTYDQCFLDAEGNLDCKFLKKGDGNGCTDGDPCTVGDQCVSGQCYPGAAMPCEDTDTDLCNGPKCVKLGETEYECEPDQWAVDGTPCTTEGGICEVGICQAGECVYVPLDLPDVCGDAVDNDCDGKVDEDCYLEYKLAEGWSTWLSGHTVSSVVGDDVGNAEFTVGHPQAVVTGTGSTGDGKYKLKTLLPKAGE